MCSAPPAVTTVFLVLSSGSVILIPPGGGRRLPWKSLMARMRNSTGAAVWACEDAASVVVIANVRTRRNRILMVFDLAVCVEFVIASAAKQSIAPHKERMDCFAALAMTAE